MIRILFFVAVILALGLGFAWLADRPGEMILTWQGQRLETSLLVGIAGLVAVVAALLLAWWLIKSIVTSPESVRRYFRHRRRDRGYQALSTGLIAAGAGDQATARKMTRRSRSLLDSDQEPLIHVLEAQTFMIEGRHDEARAKFEAMADDPETRALGLRGLYLEARRLGASEAAQHYAERAVEKAPHLAWAGQAALEYRTRDGRWDDAIRLLEKQRASRLIDKAESDRKRAVLLTARAMEALESNPREAARDAQEAIRLAPTLVPAAVTAAKALFRQNDLRRGSKILEKIWKTSPHPEVADSYVRARVGDSVQDRLRRARKLDALKPNHVESLRIVAQAALDAHEHDLARERAEAALRIQPREGLYLLLADIEEAATGDQGRVRHWMSHALRAPRDPAWTADGYVADSWAPISPVSGKLDAFVWKVPVEQIGGLQIDEQATSNDRDADFAIGTLPPVAGRPTPGGDAGTGSTTAPEKARETRPQSQLDAKDADRVGKPTKAEIDAPATVDVADTASAGRKEPPVAVPDDAVTVEAAPAKAAEAQSEPKAERSSAVVIPLQPPVARDPEPKAVPAATGATANPAAKDVAAAPEPAKTETGKTGTSDLKAAGKAKDPKPAAAAISSSASVEPAKAGGAEAVGEKSEPAASPETTRPAEAATRRKDPDREREERFLKHRIDDPGVDESKPKEQPAARFRLF